MARAPSHAANPPAAVRNGRLAYISIRPSTPRWDVTGFARILVAFDGSDDSVRAVRTACSLASKYGAELKVLHVYSFAVFAYGGAAPMPVPDVQPLEDAAKARGMATLSKGLEVARGEGVKATGELLEASSVVQAVVEYAEKDRTDLIIMGTRGMTGFKRLVMGSVSTGIVGHAHCPVLVVR